ncbi:helix-turn-helix domain-containing protein [Dactylosporangium sp. NPDC051541]|uniref:helix-turn-helix domain-containing protein n=1 Tax=Dactylosporangium sp. NPDC051541 TaxID=3363977 RepID=UPI00378A3373
MPTDDRVLSPAVLAALTYWPRFDHNQQLEPVDLAPLIPFLNELLDDLPWWNRDCRVTKVELVEAHEMPGYPGGPLKRYTEVSVPATLTDGAGHELSFFGRIRFEGSIMRRFEAKVGDTVIAPALRPAGVQDPHPFGPLLQVLMANRRSTARDLAREAGLSMSTVRWLGSGGLRPHPKLVRYLAEALGLPEADLAAIAGVSDEDYLHP